MERKFCTLAARFLAIYLICFFSFPAQAFKLISFDGKLARWNKNEVNYVVDQIGSQDFTNGCDGQGICTSETMAVRAAFQAWENVGGVDIAFVESEAKTIGKTGYDKQNSIVWVEKGWTSLPFAPPEGALAVTVTTYRTDNNEILDSDIHFNGEYFRWGVINTEQERVSDVIDIQNIATHEIGHFIGIDHSSEDIYEQNADLYLATMFFASGSGEIFRRELKDDDKAAVRNLYPSEPPELPIVESVEPRAIDLRTMQTPTVTIMGQHFSPSTSVTLARAQDRGDIGARVVFTNENEISVTFDMYGGVSSGTYDLVVANSPDAVDRVEGAIAISGGYGIPGDNPNRLLGASHAGGCTIAVSEENNREAMATGICMFLLPLLLIGLSRKYFAESRPQ